MSKREREKTLVEREVGLATILGIIAPEGISPSSKSRGGTVVTRVYIKESTYS